MLTREQTQAFKSVLESRFLIVREIIRQELLDSDEQHFIDLAGQVYDPGEASLADLLVDLQLASIHRHVEEIRDIDGALMRIARGRYGWCLGCGTPIAPERLQAYPTAKRCRACQAQHEKTHAGERVSSL